MKQMVSMVSIVSIVFRFDVKQRFLSCNETSKLPSVFLWTA